MPVSIPSAVLGLLLVFFLPGLALTRAMFPEQRVFRPLSLRTLVEQFTLSLVVSVVLVILVGFAWLGTSTGVQASWSDPLVEITLGVITVGGFAVAVGRGAFSRIPPAGATAEAEPGHEGAFELLRRLDAIGREERRLVHRLRLAGAGSSDATTIRAELDRVRAEADEVRRQRESEYAQ